MGPEDSFDDLWDTQIFNKPTRLKPRPPPDRVVGEFSFKRRTSRETMHDNARKRALDRLQKRMREENEKKRKLKQKIDKFKNLFMNVILPAIVILTILLGGVISFAPKKEVSTQTVEIVDDGRPTITRSE